MSDGKKKYYIWMAAGLLWLAVTFALCGVCVREYREKLEVLGLAGRVVRGETEEEQSLEQISAFLKGKNKLLPSDGDKVRRLLGFSDGYPDTLKKQLVHSMAVTSGITTTSLALALLTVYLWEYRRRKARDQEIQKLCSLTEDIRKERYISSSLMMDTAGEEELQKLGFELISLSESVELVRQTAREEKNGMKALVTDLAHQLRTPMTALQNSIELLGMDSLTTKEHGEFLERCQGQMQRLVELSDALIQISRMETGMIELHCEKASLFQTILKAVNRIYPRASGKDIEILMEDTTSSCEIMQDPKWLSEALINILENGIKYSDSRTKIRIRLQCLTVYIRLEIEDEGIGVPSGERNLIFKRFFRGSSRFVRNQEGQGIGLYLSRYIIEKHGGTVHVLPSKREHGSVFVVQLPKIKAVRA